MGTSAPPTVGVPAQVEDQPAVQAAEDAAAKVTPEPLKATEASIAKDFNEFADEQLKEAEAAVPAEEKTEAAKDPAVEAEGEAIAHGNIGGVISNFAGVEKEVKAGWKTTEFWLVLAGVVLTQLGTLRVPGKYGDTIQTTALIGSYALSRGLAK